MEVNAEKKYQKKIQSEQDWYRQPKTLKTHFLNAPPFYSPARITFNTGYCKTQLGRRIREILDRDQLTNPRILIAPTGHGNDLPYLRSLSQNMTGIDISLDAINGIPDATIEKHVGDIKHMEMFKDGAFDVIIMSNFFHHFVKFGFDEFLHEAKRVLRPGGHLFAFEPSILHPVAMVAWCGKKALGNITGCVEDESPFFPGRLIHAIRRCGYQDVNLTAASYSHHRMPIPVARVIHATMRPLLPVQFAAYFAWAGIYHGQKP